MSKYTPVGLTPEQLAKRAELVARLAQVKATVESALDAGLRDALTEYNDVIEEVQAFAAEVEEQADDAIAERTDSWLDTSNGDAAQAFSLAWGNFAEKLKPLELDVDDIDEDLAALPVRPDYVERRKKGR